MEYVAFLVGKDLFGIPVTLVQEISKPVQIFPVPGHDVRVAGLVELRGRTIVALDLRRCLLEKLPDDDPPARRKFIVLETTSSLPHSARAMGLATHVEPLVLVADELAGIWDGEHMDFHPPPAHVPAPFVEGVVQFRNHLMTLVSIPALVDALMPQKEESL
ncbi:MAG: chemotaxis protein CheW [Fibrobacteria bacterium]|nr:chemotaxis protein CheW [Fibrobacteria bacterium]